MLIRQQLNKVKTTGIAEDANKAAIKDEKL
jgi:hypothetical protein